MVLRRLILTWGIIMLGVFILLNPASGYDSETVMKLMRMAEIYGVGSAGNSVWAVGSHGVIFNTSDLGKTWELQESGTTSQLYSISVRENGEAWVVGRFGIVLFFVF